MADQLAPPEQEKLNEFQVITAFPEDQIDKVILLLRNNYWNLEIALSKYFDGQLEQEAARDLEAEQRPREPEPSAQQERPLQNIAFDDFHGSLLPQLPIVKPIPNTWRSQPGLNNQVDHFGLSTIRQSPILFLIFLIPRTVTFLLTGLVWLFDFFFPPAPDVIPSQPTLPQFDPTTYYEQTTADKCPYNFYPDEFNHCFQHCKKESKFMLLILVGDNGLSTVFTKQILNNPTVSEYINSHDIVPYMAHVNEAQGLAIAKNMRTRAVPAVYLLANIQSPSGISSMSLCARLPVKAMQPFLNRLTQEVERYSPELISKRVEMEELEYARKIREAQDRAYEESLIADQIKRVHKEKEEEEKQKEAEREQWLKDQKVRFYSLLRGKFDGLESLQKGQFTTIRFKLPTGESVVQRFSKDHTLFDVYSFIDLSLYTKENELEEGQEPVSGEYEHKFSFELTSPFPRYVVPVEKEKFVSDVNQLWPNGSVMLEYLEEVEDSSDDEE